MVLYVWCIIAAICSIGYPSRASFLASPTSCCFCCSANWCCLSREIGLLSGISSSGMARYFRMVVGDECNNNAISDTVSPSFRFLWANLIRSDLFAVLYSAAISSETGSASGISTLAGNSLMTYLLIASESPFIKWNRSLTCIAVGGWICCSRRIYGGPVSGHNLNVWKWCKPPANVCGLSGRNHVDYPMAFKIDHDGS